MNWIETIAEEKANKSLHYLEVTLSHALMHWMLRSTNKIVVTYQIQNTETRSIVQNIASVPTTYPAGRWMRVNTS